MARLKTETETGNREQALAIYRRRAETLVQIYGMLPLTERTLLKRQRSYAFRLINDLGGASDWRVEVDGVTIGVVVYAGGRKLCCHEFEGRKLPRGAEQS